MHHERRCTNVLSILLQDSKKIATRLLAALVSTSLISTSTSTTSTDSRAINFKLRLGHTKTSFVWQDSLFNENSTQNVVASVLPSQQLEQTRCSELIQVMVKGLKL
jgi:hypothetical protein